VLQVVAVAPNRGTSAPVAGPDSRQDLKLKSCRSGTTTVAELALCCATDLIAMAIYHLHVKVIGRKSGSSAVASAAYRSGSRLRDERLGRDQDFSAKRGVAHSEVMLPENAPERWSDRERLWNDVEAFEVRKDAQLAREVEFAIPREMNEAQSIELARDFVRSEFVARGAAMPDSATPRTS
jgi:MobA/MobL family